MRSRRESCQLDSDPMTCHACGAALSPTAKFCHKCGARVTSAPAVGWRAGVPWGIAGMALGALVTLAAVTLRSSTDETGAPFATGAGGRGAMAASDISRMSPEERARRLFDRIMQLSERGVQDSVQFFLPMAIGAYLQLPALDLDARYDMGVLYLAGEDADAALAQADTILRAVPPHLYGFMLRGRAMEAKDDARGARAAYTAFLRNEAAERARQRPEYAEHQRTIDTFAEEARRATGTARTP